MTKNPDTAQDQQDNQRSDQVEPMHDGAKAEADDFSDGRREADSDRGPAGSERGEPVTPGGTTGEHSGQQPVGPTKPA